MSIYDTMSVISSSKSMLYGSPLQAVDWLARLEGRAVQDEWRKGTFGPET